MLVRLLQKIDELGEEDEIVTVETEYAERVLLPEGLAVKEVEYKEDLRNLEDTRPPHKRWSHRFHKKAEEIADRLANTTIAVPWSADDGEVTAQDIANAVKKQTDFLIGAGKIKLDSPITSPGIYTVPVQLHRDLSFELTVKIGVE
ncbi:MAG TPA: 50S ribosomal L9 C-terminal domain-containing protein [Armatimonadota bacterium]|nr:50S ribosomal L9 C-terminal domain-containing protein [Armatimonadota bacterium]